MSITSENRSPADDRLATLFTRLARSRFRSSFRLTAGDIAYARERGYRTIAEHADRFVRERLAPAQPRKDGKQTPWRGHPVFVAQHATGTCCRGCLAKWHGIAPGAALTENQIGYVDAVIMRWITAQVLGVAPAPPATERQHQ